MRKLYHKVIGIYILGALTLFLILACNTAWREMKENEVYADHILKVVNNDMFHQEYENQLWMEKLKAEYLQRTQSLEKIVTTYAGEIGTEELQKLKKLLELGEIYLLKEDGTVYRSSDETANGKRLYADDDSLYRVLHSSLEDGSAVYLEEPLFHAIPPLFSVTVKAEAEKGKAENEKLENEKSENEKLENEKLENEKLENEEVKNEESEKLFSAVRVEIGTGTLGLTTRKDRVRKLLLRAPLKAGTTVLAVGKDSQMILARSADASEPVTAEKFWKGEELLPYLARFKAGKTYFVTLDGSLSMMRLKNYSGYYLVVLLEATTVLKSILAQFSGIFLLGIVLSASTIFLMRRFVRRYFTESFTRLNQSIEQVLSGRFDTEIEDSQVEELQIVVGAIRELKQGYVHKAERMNQIINAISSDIAVYEQYMGEKSAFLSEHFCEVMGFEPEEFAQYKSQPELLQKLFHDMVQRRDENETVVLKGRYLEVHEYRLHQNEYIGVAIDRTKEVQRRYVLERKLKESENLQGIDGLTGVLNRAGFRRSAEQRIERHPGRGVMVAFDLDNFKMINDTLGHPTGDRVLHIFALSLRRLFRNNDLIGRFGGDEFMVFLDDTVPKDRMREKMEIVLERINDAFGVYYEIHHVTASAGVAYVREEDTYQTLYARADEALYEAKKSGKGRCCFYDDVRGLS